MPPLEDIAVYRQRAEQDCISRLQQALLKEKLVTHVPCSANTSLELLNTVKPLLHPPPHPQQWQCFLNEIDNHIANHTLTLYYEEKRHKKMADVLKNAGCDNLCQWVLELSPTADKTLFFEQWASQGHPYHPCNKTKLGFSTEENFHYSPEFGFETNVRLAAIHQDNVHVETVASNFSYLEWFFHIFPQLQKNWSFSKEYIPFPMHPWQTAHLLPQQFQDLLHSNKFHLLDQVTIPTQPTLSFRTVVPNGFHPPHIKLPVAIQTTSAMEPV